MLFGSTRATHGDRPDAVLAQPTYAACGENRWDMVSPDSLCWPYGLHWHAGADHELLAVADSGNNRIVPWERS